MSRAAPRIKRNILPAANTCAMHCHVRHGMLLRSTANMNKWGILPDHIRASLARHQEHTSATCLACGYYGPMGIVKGSGRTGRAPWWLSWPVLIILCLSGVGLVVLIILLVLRELSRELSKEHSVVCPNCGRTLRV